jgi:hypothetical protein
MELDRMYTYLTWIVLGTLAVGIARQLSEQKGIYLLPDSWGVPYATHGQEGFREEIKGVQGIPEPTRVQEAGTPADTAKPSSYSILADVIPTKGTEGTLTAGSCFANDFLAQSEKTGNYIQRTNNIRQARPDSCSAPRTELVNAFYLNV